MSAVEEYQPDPDWKRRAACNGKPVEWFYPGDTLAETRDNERRAAEVCARCTVQSECLDDVAARQDYEGWRAGMRGEELRVLLHRGGERGICQLESCGREFWSGDAATQEKPRAYCTTRCRTRANNLKRAKRPKRAARPKPPTEHEVAVQQVLAGMTPERLDEIAARRARRLADGIVVIAGRDVESPGQRTVHPVDTQP